MALREGHRHTFQILQHDIRSPTVLTLFNHIVIDQIYNLACPASPLQYQKDPVKTLETSLLGISHMCALAGSHDARLLQASTSEVYGDPDVPVQGETYWGRVNCYGPRACYDEGKRAAEAMLWAYRKMSDLDTRIVRIFNTYGPGMAEHDGRVISTFITHALRGVPLPINGDGSTRRSFCYVADTIAGITRAMAGSCKDPINIGNPHEVTLRHVGSMIWGQINPGEPVRFDYRDAAPDDPQMRCPSIVRAEHELDWTPVVGLDLGLTMTINAFRARRKL
jgi:UDP-glucuronate decarboxylase